MAFRKRRVSGPELRKSPRRNVRYPAKIDVGDGSAAHACNLSDISATGARLTAAAAQELPDEFTLQLGAVRRKCRVVWRSDNQLGVQFLSGT